jgi:hypothetical protein
VKLGEELGVLKAQRWLGLALGDALGPALGGALKEVMGSTT